MSDLHYRRHYVTPFVIVTVVFDSTFASSKKIQHNKCFFQQRVSDKRYPLSYGNSIDQQKW